MSAKGASQFALDRELTIKNREKLAENRNLLFWYAQLYRHQFEGIPQFSGKRILEIGSGTSPLKRFHPHVLTSDVLDLDYLDFVFDCHDIDCFEEIPDASLDVITLTNVLHHLRDPVEFMVKAAGKLKEGGRLIATEPYFSLLSKFIYERIHHEPVDFDIEEPRLASIEGPLSSANIALPFLIFTGNRNWMAPLESRYEISREIRPFTALSYMITGGISRRIAIPRPVYRLFFAMDALFSRISPSLLASFFTIEMVRSPAGPNSS